MKSSDAERPGYVARWGLIIKRLGFFGNASVWHSRMEREAATLKGNAAGSS